MKILQTTSMPFLLFIVLAISQRMCHAQNSPQNFLNAHNAARFLVGVGPMKWDANVTAFAQKFVNSRLGDCKLVHSTNRTYGENLAKGSGGFTATDAVRLWVAEKHNYNYETNSCVRGVCLHYTQVVWRNSVSLGCARGRCNNGWWFISCNYAPPGNIVGQRPY